MCLTILSTVLDVQKAASASYIAVKASPHPRYSGANRKLAAVPDADIMAVADTLEELGWFRGRLREQLVIHHVRAKHSTAECAGFRAAGPVK